MLSGKFRKIILRLSAPVVCAALLIAPPGPSGGGNSVARAEMVTGKEILSENFDDTPDGELPDGWTVGNMLKNGGSAFVRDGKLIIDASGVELGKVLLPESLSGYGDYTVEADVTFLSSRDESRWMSLVVRQQESDENYYHMCVRRRTTASNGVEFAVRSLGAWNVMNTAAASKDLGLNRETRVRISISGDRVFEYVDGELVIQTDAPSGLRKSFATGGVAIQANFSVISVDNVKVSECSFEENAEGYVNDRYMSHDFLKTSVISAAATVAEAGSMSDLESFAALPHRPESVILYVNDSGMIVSSDGQTLIGPIEGVNEKVFRNMLPVFYVRSEAAAGALTEYLKNSRFVDCMVMSHLPELVEKVRADRTKVGGIIDFSSAGSGAAGKERLDGMIRTANSHLAKTVLISGDVATKENVEYLQHRLITVWVRETANEPAMLHDAIQSGANGIVTDTPGELISAYGLYDKDIAVLVRNPMIIGHRGLPSAAPENSVESAKEAVAAGADCIELDVRLSSDGKIYIYHDPDLSSLTSGKGSVNSHTAAELDGVSVLRSSGYGRFKKYPKVRLPSLDEFFEALKDDDVMFFIEIKEEAGGISEKVAETVRRFGLEDRCCMISFLNSQVTAFQKALPGMSVGRLMGTPSGTSYENVVKSVIDTIGRENATFNASGVYDTKLIRALMYRGITSWPWTYNSSNSADAYLLGAGGITTDHSGVASHIPTKIDVGEKTEYTLNPTEPGKNSITFFPVVLDRLGTVEAGAVYTNGNAGAVPEPVIIEGADLVSVEGNTLKALKDGRVRLMYRYAASTVPGAEPDLFTRFTIYTQVITVNIDSGAEVDPSSLPSPSPGGSSQAAGGKSDVREIIAVCAAVALAIAVCCVFLAVFSKKKSGGENNN